MAWGRRPRREYPRVSNPNRLDRKQNALLASGFRVQRKDGDVLRRLVQPWQTRAFNYYDMVPEIKYAAQFYARLLSPLRLYAAEIDEKGEVTETKNPEALAALDRIQDPGGGRTGLLSAYGRLMFLTGECYLFVTRDLDTGLEQWEMLSTDELRIMSGIYMRYKAPSLIVEEFHEPSDDDWEPVDDDTAVAFRLWQRHPRWSWLADSTMQGVLDIAEELILLTQAVRARARSRLAGSGILLIDDSISPPPLEPEPDENIENDPFIFELTQAMTQPIVDEGSASQVVPLVVRVKPGDGMKVGEMITHLQVIDPMQLYPETGLRYECVKRLAIGLDMPPEELLGLMDANHWTAWQVDEQTWKAHGQQKAQQLCDDLTSAYMRPYLRQSVGMADWARYCVAYDAAAAINHPDRSKDAKDLFDKRAISKAALRDACAFNDDDAPTKEELAEMVGIAVHDASLAWDGIPSVKPGGIEPEPGVIETADTQGANGSKPLSGGDVEKGPPEDAPSDPPVSQVGSMVARVVGASDLALLRAREAAGSRLRSHAKRDADALKMIEGAKPREVAALLGRERVRSLRLNETDLVAGVSPLIVDACRLFGITDEGVARVIAETVERYAARTLYDRPAPPLPVEFPAYIASVLAGSNGG